MTAIAELLKDSAYKLGQFKPVQIAALESSITLKESGKKTAPYVTCLVRGKSIKLTPEEAVRQLYVMVLRDDLGYLRLPPVCALMDLHTSASLYPAISETDLLALPIPKIPAATQRAIEKSALAARQARQRATQLLDTAKRAVEIAIEDSESAALAHLNASAGKAR